MERKNNYLINKKVKRSPINGIVEKFSVAKNIKKIAAYNYVRMQHTIINKKNTKINNNKHL